MESASHRKRLMKQYGLQDARGWTTDSIRKKRKDFLKESNSGRKGKLENIYKDIRKGKVDMRKYMLAQKKAEYEMRNHGKVLGR